MRQHIEGDPRLTLADILHMRNAAERVVRLKRGSAVIDVAKRRSAIQGPTETSTPKRRTWFSRVKANAGRLIGRGSRNRHSSASAAAEEEEDSGDGDDEETLQLSEDDLRELYASLGATPPPPQQQQQLDSSTPDDSRPPHFKLWHVEVEVENGTLAFANDDTTSQWSGTCPEDKQVFAEVEFRSVKAQVDTCIGDKRGAGITTALEIGGCTGREFVTPHTAFPLFLLRRNYSQATADEGWPTALSVATGSEPGAGAGVGAGAGGDGEDTEQPSLFKASIELNPQPAPGSKSGSGDTAAQADMRVNVSAQPIFLVHSAELMLQMLRFARVPTQSGDWASIKVSV